MIGVALKVYLKTVPKGTSHHTTIQRGSTEKSHAQKVDIVPKFVHPSIILWPEVLLTEKWHITVTAYPSPIRARWSQDERARVYHEETSLKDTCQATIFSLYRGLGGDIGKKERDTMSLRGMASGKETVQP